MTKRERSNSLKSSLVRLKRKKVQGTESTYVYENGVVLNEKTGYATTGRITGKSPYQKVNITYTDGTRRTVNVHRLMGELYLNAAWKANRNKVVSFIDGSYTNTRLNNLKLTTRKSVADRSINVLNKRWGGLTTKTVREIRSTYSTYKNPKVAIANISKSYKVSRQAVNNIVNRVTYKNI